MNLLGAFMTVLRVEQAWGTLIHAPLDRCDDGAADLSLDLPDLRGGPAPVAGWPGVTAAPSGEPRTIHLTRGQDDLRAEPWRREAAFHDAGAGRFEFLPVQAAELAHLRRLLGARWARGETPDGPRITVTALFPFLLDLGLARLDLRRRMPRPLPGGAGYAFDTEAGEITITHAGEARAEIELCKRAAYWQPPPALAPAALRGGADRWFQIEGEEEVAHLPVTVCDADANWLIEKPYPGQDEITGLHRCRPIVAHEADKYVLLSRFAEGVIFDEHGVCNEDGYLEGYGYRGATPMLPPPPGMRCDHGRLFIDRQALADAPFVAGDTIVFILGNLSNYTHWLIDGLLALHVLLDYAPPGAQLLLPGTLGDLKQAKRRVLDHHDSLRAFGFGHLPAVEIAGPYCRVEHAWWLEAGAVFNMPGAAMRGLRARVAGLRPPPPRRDRRIHIDRRHGRRLANGGMLVPFLESRGFQTHYMEDYSIAEQIDMFSQAEWVIGPHGAELGNLLFCPEGTRVLEISPDYDYKSYFSTMCNKLGLRHGVLPCSTTDASFNGEIIVNMPKFAALFRMLKNRL